MAIPLLAWWRGKKEKRNDPFTRATRDDLDIVMPLPYDMTDTVREKGHAMVRGHVEKLKPNALDAGSREVLNNLINAWADREIAHLDAERDERQAVGLVLIGLARQEVARRKALFDADLATALHAREALGAAFEALTGKRTADYGSSFPARFDDNPVSSTLGPVKRDYAGPLARDYAEPDPALQLGSEPADQPAEDPGRHRRPAVTDIQSDRTPWPATNGSSIPSSSRIIDHSGGTQ